MFEVYDDRTNEVVFQSSDRNACIDYLDNIGENSDDFAHLWLNFNAHFEK